MPVLGRPLLDLQLERIARCTAIGEVVVATTTSERDTPVADLCRRLGVPVFRGSEQDVLDRYYQAALFARAETVVRFTADCPLLDPQVTDRTVRLFLDGPEPYAYVSNAVPPSFPDGLDTEVFSAEALATAWREAVEPAHREHVTPFLWEQPDRFRIGVLRCDVDLSSLRWTVDYPADLEFVRGVYEALYATKPGFGMEDVLELLERQPAMASINGGLVRNEWYVQLVAARAQRGG